MARSTRKAWDYRKTNTFCKYILMQIYIYISFFTLFHTITLLANKGCFSCGSALQLHSQVLLNPVTWTQKIIQIHDDLPLLTTDWNKSPVGIQSKSLQSCTNTKHSLNELWVWRGKGNSQILCSIMQYKTESMMAWILDEQFWAYFVFFYVFTK